MAKVTATKDQYDSAFLLEARQKYPSIDQFEKLCGHAIDHEWLLRTARVLACPVKVNPPNWQHGRVIYAAFRRWIDQRGDDHVNMLDIGTAKGFSSLCMVRAALDAHVPFKVTSVDVIDPDARARRNTVAEVDGLRTLYETLQPWPESRAVEYVWGKGENWLMMNRGRVHFAFVDGKHTYDAVKKELGYLSMSQSRGDVVILDDVQIPGVAKAVEELRGYEKVGVNANADRSYVIAEKQ